MDIRIELDDVTAVKKRLRVEIPAEQALEEFNRVANDYKKRARLPGFRPGKAPVELIKRRFQKDIRQDVVGKLVPESYHQAVQEKGLRPLGRPQVDRLEFEEGKPLVYEARFEVGPQVVLPEYRGLQVSVQERPVTDEEIQAEIEKLREKLSRLVPVPERPLEAGDYAVVDLQGSYVEQEGHQHHRHHPIREENVLLKVGDEQTLQAFNDALMGMNPGQEKRLEVDYPADYPQKKLAGHKILFRLHLKEIKRKELPEVNDDFAKDVGDFETLAQLQQKIREELAEQQRRNRENNLKQQLINRLVEEKGFEVPEVLVEERVDDRIRDLAYNIAAQGVDPSKANVDWAKVRAQIRAEAERDVRASIIFQEIASREGIEVSNPELESELNQMADSMNQPIEKVRQHFREEGRMEQVRKELLRRKALQLVLENAKVAGDI